MMTSATANAHTSTPSKYDTLVAATCSVDPVPTVVVHPCDETYGDHHLRAALGRKVPAVVITGDIRSETVDPISSQGVSVVIKPFSADELLKALRGE